MIEKVKIELEYLLKTSPKVLENMISTPSGLSEWFADDVSVRDDVYGFEWDNSEEKARILTKRVGSKMRFQWLADEEDGNDYYFEMKIAVDDMTKMVVLAITDFAEIGEEEETSRLWESSVHTLRGVIGA
ncbi:MAG: START-like domain-containing protein [Bacteroidota bacterium]